MFTEKEIRVLRLKNEGFSQKEIARKLRISQPAVSDFYSNAMRKLDDAEEMLKLKKELKLKTKKRMKSANE